LFLFLFLFLEQTLAEQYKRLIDEEERIKENVANDSVLNKKIKDNISDLGEKGKTTVNEVVEHAKEAMKSPF